MEDKPWNNEAFRKQLRFFALLYDDHGIANAAVFVANGLR